VLPYGQRYAYGGGTFATLRESASGDVFVRASPDQAMHA
jgi:hypothetical protein